MIKNEIIFEKLKSKITLFIYCYYYFLLW